MSLDSSEGTPVTEPAKQPKSGGWTAPRKGGYSATGGSVRSKRDGRLFKPEPPTGRGAASMPSKKHASR